MAAFEYYFIPLPELKIASLTFFLRSKLNTKEYVIWNEVSEANLNKTTRILARSHFCIWSISKAQCPGC